jgi:hypothetical protein
MRNYSVIIIRRESGSTWANCMTHAAGSAKKAFSADTRLKAAGLTQ